MSRILRHLARFRRSSSAPARTPRDLRARLWVSPLEDRVVPNTYTVSNTGDNGGVNPAFNAGTGTLRQAIVDANNNAGLDDIVFNLGAGPQTINLAAALPIIASGGGAATITGPGASLLTVQRDPAAGTAFRIIDSTTTALNLTGFTISGGNGIVDGGGIRSSGTLTLDSMVVSGNTALGSGIDGGGISMNAGAFLMVRNTTISGNTAGRSGGGIYFVSGGGLVIENSTISGNTANAVGATAFDYYGGGAFYFFGTPSAAPPAGFTASTLVVRNSTLANNTSAKSGGAIMLEVATQTLLIQNSTITGNTANTSAGGVYGGGGIAKDFGSITITIQNSVVSGNTTPNTGTPDIVSNSTVNVNFSAIGSTAGFTLTGANNRPVGENLLLGPLTTANGGITATMAPQASGPASPLINAGSNGLVPGGLSTDQRGPGYTRTFGTVDIGAFEVQPVGLPSASATSPNVTTAGGTSQTVTVVYADLTGTNNGIDVSTLGSADITVTGPGGTLVGTFGGFSPAGNGTPRTALYTFTPPGGFWDGGDNGTYTVNMIAGQVLDQDGNAVPAGPIGAFTVSLPPANDTVAGAIPLTLGIPVNGTLVSATNDYNLTGATTTQFVGSGQTVSTAPGRDVVYSFTAPAAGNYVLRLNFGMGANYVLYVAAALAPGTVTATTGLASNRNTVAANASEELSGPLAAGQQVFVVVDTNSAADVGGTFRLEVILANPEAASNDTTATAQPLNSNVTGSLVSPDHDFYSLGTPAAGSRVFAMIDTAAAANFDSELRVVTDVDTLEYDDDDSDIAFGGPSAFGSVIAGTQLTGVPSYLLVRYRNITTATPSATSSEPYRFHAVVQPPSASATVESDPGGTANNTVATANTGTNNYFSGTLASGTDVDIYGTRAAAGDVLFVALDLNPTRDGTNFDGQLALLDDAGNVLVAVNGGTTSSTVTSGAGTLFAVNPLSPSEGFWFRVSTAGNYFIRVTGAAAGDYLLSVSKNGTTGGGGLAPTLGGLTGTPVTINDTQTATPFAAATVSGGTVTVRVTYTAAKGAFTNAAGLGFTGSAGDYAITGTNTAVQTALRALAFDPTDNRVAVGASENTVFTVSLYSGSVSAPYPAADASNNLSNVTATSVNDAPGFAGVNPAPQPVGDNATVNPFSTVVVAEPDPGQSVTVGLTYSTINGDFTNATALGFTGSPGIYTFGGTPAAAQSALQGLTFAPTPNLLAVGATTDVVFTLSVTDAVAPLTTDNQTTVQIIGANDAPVLGGVTTAAQLVLDTATVLPFTGVTITDADPGQNVTVTVVYLSTDGAFTNAASLGFAGTAGSYSFTGSLAAAVTAIRGLTFTPAQDLVAVGTTTTTAFTISVADTGPPVTDSQTTVVSTSVNSVPRFTAGPNVTVNEDGGAASATWATAVDGGPGAEAGQTVTFTVNITGTTGGLTFTTAPTIAPDGTLTFQPAPNAYGTATVEVTLQDTAGTADGGVDTSATQTFTITVNPVNDAPSFTLPSTSVTGVPEDAALQTVSGFATNISGGPFDEAGQTVAFTVLVTGGTLTFTTAPTIDATTGALMFRAAPNANGTATLTVTLQDSGLTANGGVDTSAAQTFSITVDPGNDAPVNNPLTNSAVAIGATTLLTGLSVTEPIDNVPGTTAGYTTTVSVPTGAGTFSGTGFTAGNGSESITVSGTLNQVNAALATLTYTPVANAPSVTITVVSSDGGNTGGGTLSDNDTFVLVIKVRPVVTTSVGTTVFTENGPAVFVDAALTVTDSDSGDLTRAVVKLNGFVAGQDVLTYTGALPTGVSADTSVPGQITFLTVSGITLVADYEALLRTVTYANTSEFPATTPRVVTFTVTDEAATSLTSDPASKPIDVTDLNDAPVLAVAVPNTSVFEEATVGVAGVSVSDVDAGFASIRVTLSTTAGTLAAAAPGVTVTANPQLPTGPFLLILEGSQAAVNTALTSLTFTGATDFIGSALIAVLADDLGNTGDPGPRTATGSFSVTVLGVNDAPSFTPGPNVTVLEDSGAGSVLPWATNILRGPADEAGQGVTFSVSNNFPGFFTVAPAIDSSGNLTFTLRPNSVGVATVTVTLKDDGLTANGGDDTSDPITFTITITGVNDVPSFTGGGDVSVTEDSGPRSLAGWARGVSPGPVDESTQLLTFLVTSTNVSSSGGALFAVLPAVDANGTLTFTPAANANGTANVSVRVMDNGGGSDTSAAQTFVITVVSLNDPPQFLLPQPPLSSLVAGPGSAPVTIDHFVTSMFAGAPDEVGQTFTFEVANNGEVLFSQQPTITPVFNTSGPFAGMVTGRLTFAPSGSRSGLATVTVRLRDSGGDTFGVDVTPPVQTFTITVNGSNTAPSFTAGPSQTAAEDAGPQTVANWATNISAGLPAESTQALTFVVTTPQSALFAAGPAVSANGTLTYTPAANAVGTATVTVKLMDDGGTAFGGFDTSAVQTFTIQLTPVNDPPVFTIPSGPVGADPANGPRTVPGFATGIAAGPADEAGQSVSFLVTVTVTSGGGLFTAPPAINPVTGALTFTPAAGANGTASVSVRLQDNGTGANLSAPQTFTIVVAAGAQNSPPTAGPDAITVAANSGPTAVPVLTNDSFTPDTGETLSVTAVGAAANGLATLTGGAVFYAPASGFSGTDTFTYTLSDGNGGTATGTVTVTVTPPPVDPPTPPTPPTVVSDLVAIGDQTGSRVRVVNAATGRVQADFLAFPGFDGGVNATLGDVTGDGVPDVIVGAGAGGGPVVKVFDGRTFAEVASFHAFLPSLRGGVHVAAADVNGDGRTDLVLGAGAGGGPHVKIVDGTKLDQRDADNLPAPGALLGSFFAYANDFLGGVSVAAADVDGDGRAEVVTGAGSGGSPHVKVYAGGTLREILSVIPYNPDFRGGVNVGAGDLDGDGLAEIITGAGAGGGPHVGIYDGRTGASKGQFFAFASNDTTGVTVAVRPLAAGGATLVAASGSGALKTYTVGKEVDLLDGALFGGISVG